MEMRDGFRDTGPGQAGPHGALARVSTDRLELKRGFVQEAEEEQVEQALNLYAKAARQWAQPDGPEAPPEEEDLEKLEAMSQQLKLKQKCQDIAAQIIVDDMDLTDGEEEE